MTKIVRRQMARLRALRARFMRQPPQARLAILGFGVSTLVVALLVAAQVGFSYQDNLENARTRMQQTTRTVAAYLSSSLTAAEQFAGEARNAALDSKGTATLTRLQARLERLVPVATGLMVWDANGKVTFGRPSLAGTVNVPKSGAWATLRNGSGRDGVFGEVILGQNDARLLPMAWRVDDSKGKFAGAVAVILDLRKLQPFLGEAERGKTLTALYRTDGQLLMMSPGTADYANQNHANSPLFQSVLPTSDAGLATLSWALARNDAPRAPDQAWLVAYEKLKGGTLVVAQMERRSDIAGGWSGQRAAFVLLGLGLVMMLSAVMVLIVRQARAQECTQNELKAARERFDLAVSGTNDGIWDWDLVHNEMYFSPVWYQILGYVVGELPAATSTWANNLHGDDIEQAQRKLQIHLAGQSDMFHDTHRMRCKDGSYIWIEARARAVRDASGTPIRMVGTITNVEQRKRYELALKAAKDQAEAANVSKSRFLANMSHELRTPLNGIIGFSEITRDQLFGPVGSPKYLEYANDIHQGATHLLSLINDILDFSKIDAGKMELSMAPMDLRATLEHAMRMMRTVAIEKHVTLQLDAPRDLPYLVADERAVRQMLLNLLSNAIKFSNNGKKVTLQAATTPVGGVEIRVVDQGKGIAPEFHAKIFEPFEQVDDIMTRTHKGTGLGLPLVKALTEMHGGEVQLESEVNRGTTVTLRFPARAVVEPGTRRSA